MDGSGLDNGSDYRVAATVEGTKSAVDNGQRAAGSG